MVMFVMMQLIYLFLVVFIYLIGGGVCVRNLAVASTSILRMLRFCFVLSPGQTIFLQKIRFERERVLERF